MNRSDDVDEDDDDRPRRRRRDRDDDDDDRPSRASRRRGDDIEDDYDDHPRSRRRQPGDGLAIASMIIGIVSVVVALFGWCCCAYFGSGFSVILGVLAVILGFVSRSQGSRSGMGLAGIITG